MKKQFLFILLLALAANVFSQPTTTTAPAVKPDYLKKSKNQKTVSYILAGTGGAMTTVGLIIALNEISGGYGPGSGSASANNNDALAATLSFSGLALLLVSSFLHKASLRNKKKAIGISLKNEAAPQLQNSSFLSRSVPSLTLKISL
jgi:hypothetical protein